MDKCKFIIVVDASYNWKSRVTGIGLHIAKKRGYRLVKVRSDYNSMRTKLKRDHARNVGHCRTNMDGTILRLAKEFDEVKFAYQARRKNQIAHRLARIAATELEPQDAAEYLVED